jgi:hypothetical protein
MVAGNSKSKPFLNLYLAYLLKSTVIPKTKSNSKSKSQPVSKTKTKAKTKAKTKTTKKKSLDSKSRPTDKPKFRTVTETLTKGGTPFLKRRKRVPSVSGSDTHEEREVTT